MKPANLVKWIGIVAAGVMAAGAIIKVLPESVQSFIRPGFDS